MIFLIRIEHCKANSSDPQVDHEWEQPPTRAKDDRQTFFLVPIFCEPCLEFILIYRHFSGRVFFSFICKIIIKMIWIIPQGALLSLPACDGAPQHIHVSTSYHSYTYKAHKKRLAAWVAHEGWSWERAGEFPSVQLAKSTPQKAHFASQVQNRK